MEYLQIGIGVLSVVFGAALTVCMIQNYRMRKRIQKGEEELLNSYRSLKTSYDEEVKTKKILSERCEELVRSREHMQKTAYTDYLTGLPNRFGYSEHLREELRDLKQGELLGIIDLDIDNFRVINDSYGHSYGDETLCEISKRLTRIALGRDAYLARVGGDGFTVILKNQSN